MTHESDGVDVHAEEDEDDLTKTRAVIEQSHGGARKPHLLSLEGYDIVEVEEVECDHSDMKFTARERDDVLDVIAECRICDFKTKRQISVDEFSDGDEGIEQLFG